MMELACSLLGERRKITFIYDAGPHAIDDLRLIGSWNATGVYSPEWSHEIPMSSLGEGVWSATGEFVDDGTPHDWEWGVVANGPAGDRMWAVMGEENLKFDVADSAGPFTYAPTTYHYMGVRRFGEAGVRVRLWAPNARAATLKLYLSHGDERRFMLHRIDGGDWVYEDPTAWPDFVGCPYAFELTDSTGIVVERQDPYALVVQGTQRGLGLLYIDAQTGKETAPPTPIQVAHFFRLGLRGDNLVRPPREKLLEFETLAGFSGALGHLIRASILEFVTFEVHASRHVVEAELVFLDKAGQQLNKDALLTLLGQADPSLVLSAREGRFNDLWTEHVRDDGTIEMVDLGGTFSAIVNSPSALFGLNYRFRTFTCDERGVRVPVEADANDKWDSRISAASGISIRRGIVAEPTYPFRYDATPRERNPAKWTIYQLHVGSVLGSACNTCWSTLGDVQRWLCYLKELGVTTIQLLPVGQFEKSRDWGYMGATTLAVQNSYSFPTETGTWLTGAEALMCFVDEAHGHGLNVVNDVVYNHIGAYYNNLWNFDGPSNPYFNWSPESAPRNTSWGAMPAFSNSRVRQFIVDHAVAQIESFHLDGLRFDFTDPIVEDCRPGGGILEFGSGSQTLREINRQVHYYRPGVWTVCEQYADYWSTTLPADRRQPGVGFDARYFVNYEHQLVTGYSSSLLDCAANGRWTNIDSFMATLVNGPPGSPWAKATAIISNHDEVGNSQRIVLVAKGLSNAFLSQWAVCAAHTVAVLGFMAPGIPMFFQGDESLAQNGFKWAIPSTWDLGWEWRSRFTKASITQGGLNDAVAETWRRQTWALYRAAVALRASSLALSTAGSTTRVHTHNDESVLAYARSFQGDAFVIVASLNRKHLPAHGIEFPSGTWKQILNSNEIVYGGDGFGTNAEITGNAALSIPAAGSLVFRRLDG